MGSPILYFDAESTSTIDACDLSRQYAASCTNGMNMRLTMKPGTSFLHSIGVFFTSLTRFMASSVTWDSVFKPGIISTKGINCGGLKKCKPMNFSGLVVNAEISDIGKVLVFDAKIMSSVANFSISSYTLFFKLRSSGTASMTRLELFRDCSRSTTG